MLNPDLESLTLLHGKHEDRDDGLCLMEAVAYFAGEPHSDTPKCACPALTKFGMTLNDRMSDTERQLLKPLIPRLIGTRDGNELLRGKILAWAAVTEFAPAALRAGGFEKEAKNLESLRRYDWKSAKRVAEEAKRAAYAAYAAADAAAADAAAYAAADAAAADAAAADAADAAAYAAAHAKVFDLALAAFDRAIRLEEPK